MWDFQAPFPKNRRFTFWGLGFGASLRVTPKQVSPAIVWSRLRVDGKKSHWGDSRLVVVAERNDGFKDLKDKVGQKHHKIVLPISYREFFGRLQHGEI